VGKSTDSFRYRTDQQPLQTGSTVRGKYNKFGPNTLCIVCNFLPRITESYLNLGTRSSNTGKPLFKCFKDGVAASSVIWTSPSDCWVSWESDGQYVQDMEIFNRCHGIARNSKSGDRLIGKIDRYEHRFLHEPVHGYVALLRPLLTLPRL
jgi:hypothetical protein